MELEKHFLEWLSQILGWAYTILWSLSSYPQPILNYKRTSTVGTTIDYPVINVLGFLAYLIYITVFYFSDEIRSQYALRNNGLMPTVQPNDLAFAAHAFILSLVTLSQHTHYSWWRFEKPKTSLGARPSMAMSIIFAGCLGYVFTITQIVLIRHYVNPRTDWATIDIIYAISYLKLIATFVKYIPQVKMNIKNKSTTGWSIDQILLDMTGGVLSILQLCVDSYKQGDWSGITGNPAKLLLGNLSVLFDIIFMIQHYSLYNTDVEHMSDENEPLFADSDV
ncbi:Cystinosin-like protein [Golovinomyces cichoracearum]|uniref:Cystinosin-like protein n=1 Tax=Golovinomyces cichoracearum TaxID=62708 RepID=A0A420HHE0_9PEZI|nr:Cystinosin-like protein [Golovinomyces cichoracearum]